MVDYNYAVVDMRDIDYRTLYDRNSPDALVLAILGDFGGRKPSEVVRMLLEKLRTLVGQDEGQLREYLQMLEILADNRHFNIDIQEAYEMLRIDIERLPSYQKGMEKGMEKGEHGKALDVAQKLLALNFSPEQVAAITQLSLAEISHIQTKSSL